jgi:hypothetical protein
MKLKKIIFKSHQDISHSMKTQFKSIKNRLCIKGQVYRINKMLWFSSRVLLITQIIRFKIFQSQARVLPTSGKHTVLLLTLVVIINIIEIRQLIIRSCSYSQIISKMVIKLETQAKTRELINSLKYEHKINI